MVSETPFGSNTCYSSTHKSQHFDLPTSVSLSYVSRLLLALGPAALSLPQAQTGTESVPFSAPLTELRTTWTTQGDSRDSYREVQGNAPPVATTNKT